MLKCTIKLVYIPSVGRAAAKRNKSRNMITVVTLVFYDIYHIVHVLNNFLSYLVDTAINSLYSCGIC